MMLKLTEDINSAEDLKAVIEEITEYRTYFRHTQIKSKFKNGVSRGDPDLSVAAVELMTQAKGTKPITLPEIDQLLTELEKLYAKAPKIRVVLAAAPTPAIKKTLSQWIRKNIAELILIDYRFDSTILGGMIVIFGSHIYDWSLRREILASKDKLNEILAHV